MTGETPSSLASGWGRTLPRAFLELEREPTMVLAGPSSFINGSVWALGARDPAKGIGTC